MPNRFSQRLSTACLSVVLGVGASSVAATGHPQGIVAVADETARIGVGVKSLLTDYDNPQVASGLRPFSERMTDGEILFLLGDFQRASLVLFDLVSDQNNTKEPLYGRATYYLAESFFQIGNDGSARGYFEQLVNRRETAHLKDAVRRLIQIADRGQRWDGLDAQIDVLKSQGPLPPDIQYIQAKSLLRQGRAALVDGLLAGFPRDHRLWPKAAYLLAVAKLALGNYEGARTEFATLKKMQGEFEDLDIVRDEAAMNEGRILFEQGKLTESADAYQAVGRASGMFEESLYEVTWIYVRAAGESAEQLGRELEYKKALNALEILILSGNESALLPEARLLLGNIFLRLGRFEDASTAFGEVVSRYAPVRDELVGLTGKITDPLEYYEEVATRSKQGAGLLPPLAVKWAADGVRLQQAMEVVSDLSASETWVRDADEIVKKLMAALESDNRAQLFPTLREAEIRRRGLLDNVTQVSERLLLAEREALLPHMTADERRELDAVLAERAAIEPAYRKLPQRREEYDSRDAELRSRVVKIEQAAYQQRYPLRAMQGELDAIRAWLVDHPEALKGNDGKEFRERMAQQERELVELHKEQELLEAELVRERSALSISEAANQQDEVVRGKYAASLEKERDLLGRAKARAPERQVMLAEIEGHRLTLATYLAELERFGRKLHEVIAQKAHDIKAAVLAEVALLEAQRQEIESTRNEAQRVVGEVAALELDLVREKFHDIVLRADVGIVDVAWQIKEEQTHEISRRVNEQRKELQVLDAEFQEVLGGE